MYTLERKLYRVQFLIKFRNNTRREYNNNRKFYKSFLIKIFVYIYLYIRVIYINSDINYLV